MHVFNEGAVYTDYDKDPGPPCGRICKVCGIEYEYSLFSCPTCCQRLYDEIIKKRPSLAPFLDSTAWASGEERWRLLFDAILKEGYWDDLMRGPAPLPSFYWP